MRLFRPDRLDFRVRRRSWCQGSVDRFAAAKPPLTPGPPPTLCIQAIRPPSASHCSDVGWADRLFGPGFSTRDHGVYEDQELPGAGDKRRLVRLSFGNQALIQRDELSVPTERGRQGRAIQSAPYALTAAFDMARTDLATAVIVVGGKSSKRGNLFARDAADLRHAHQDGDRRRQPDAVHALDRSSRLARSGCW